LEDIRRYWIGLVLGRLSDTFYSIFRLPARRICHSSLDNNKHRTYHTFYTPCPVHERLSGGRFISSIQVSAVSPAQIPKAKEELRKIMREAHKLTQGEEDDFTIQDQADLATAATETSKILTILLGSVAGVSLIVGGIGIMNIMLVSVTERTREIGIRLSIGARSSDILIQFLTEAVVLSLAGGILGVSLSFGVSYLQIGRAHV